MTMGFKTERTIHQMNSDHKMLKVYDTYYKYTNYRFDYVIRASFSRFPIEINRNDYSALDHPYHEVLLAGINNKNGKKVKINNLRKELKTLTKEVNSKKKEINIILLNEDGLKKNIKHLEDIISIKEKFMIETANYTQIRCNAKEKVQKEYYKTNKKYIEILSQLSKSHKASHHNGVTTDLERLNERVLRYEEKIKKMDGVIQIATDSEEKLQQYKNALKTSKNRLKIFYDQLSSMINNRQELTLQIVNNERRIQQLKMNLSNLGLLSSIEKNRVHTSSSLLRNDDMKQEFLELQSLRTEVLSLRPKGMFNPKYQKVDSLTKEEIRRYFENDEAINSIDYLFELKNNKACKYETSLFKTNSNESIVFLKILSVLSIEELKRLLIHYFNRVVDLKESGKENDDLIAKLDEIHDRQRRNIITINNNFQEFHLSIEKKCTGLKKYYQDKLHLCFQLFQDECTALTMFRMKQEIALLKKKIIDLEKSKKSKEPVVTPDRQESRNKSSNEVNTSVSGSESTTAIKLMNLRNKLKINRNKSK